MLLTGLPDFGKCGVQCQLRAGQVNLQRIDCLQLGVQLGIHFLAALHHLQQGIFQAALASLQGLKLVLQIRLVLRVRRTRTE